MPGPPRLLAARGASGIVIAALAVAACRGERTARGDARGDRAAARTTPPSASPSLDADAVDRLRALGYVGFTPAHGEKHGSGVVVNDRRASYPGYNLFTNRNLCSAAMIDAEGAIKNYWETSPCGHWSNAELLPSGDVVVAGEEPTPGGVRDPEGRAARRYLLRMAWDGHTVWKRPLPSHHDVDVLPSGKLMTLYAVHRKIPEVDPRRPVRDNHVAMLTPDGKELESVSLYDLFKAAPDLVKLQRVKGDRDREIDLFHANSVEWVHPTARGDAHPLYSTSNVLVSIRHQDTAVILDWRTRKIVWAWGQGEISGPHDATMLPTGNILIFDNGLSRGWSRVVELDPVRRRIVWQYHAPDPKDFFTTSRGSNQRLPNGNTLIAQSDSGRAFEVTPEGRIVWDFWNPFGNAAGERATIVRIKRYELAQVDSLVQRLGEGRRQAPAKAALTAGSPGPAASPSRPH